jgi:hypothetical protein
MATKINPPVYGKSKNYQLFKKEVEEWRVDTVLIISEFKRKFS